MENESNSLICRWLSDDMEGLVFAGGEGEPFDLTPDGGWPDPIDDNRTDPHYGDGSCPRKPEVGELAMGETADDADDNESQAKVPANRLDGRLSRPTPNADCDRDVVLDRLAALTGIWTL